MLIRNEDGTYSDAAVVPAAEEITPAMLDAAVRAWMTEPSTDVRAFLARIYVAMRLARPLAEGPSL
jgi:hypothetical protein